MEDPSSVIRSNLANIIELIKNDRFDQGLQVSESILDLSSKLKMRDESIMCKIIFDGLTLIQNIKRRYKISDEIKNNLNASLLANLTTVSNTHIGNDESVAYSSLKDLHEVFMRIEQDSVIFQMKYSRLFSDRVITADDEDEDEK